MTLFDYINRNTPEYNKAMYLDGYSPETILAACRKQMIDNYRDNDDGDYQVSITTEMKVKK